MKNIYQRSRLLVANAADLEVPGYAIFVSGATAAGSVVVKLPGGCSVTMSLAVGENYLMTNVAVVGVGTLPAGASAWALN